MKYRGTGRILRAVGLFAVGGLLCGCKGDVSTPDVSSEASTDVPPFKMPGTDVLEVTTDSTLDQTENSSQEETQPSEISIEYPIDLPTENSTEASVPSVDEGDYVVVLDPGHGGTWVGALDGTYREKDLALKTALYCRDYLLDNFEDVTVYLTRETDKEFSYDQKKDLEDRVKFADEYGADILVSLHFNSDPADTSNGALVCVSKQPWVADESAALAKSILNQLSLVGLADKGLLYRDSVDYFDEYGNPMDYYAICRHSASLGMPGIIVEHCFMRNAVDRRFYETDEALMELGRADAVGIAEYLGLNRKE